MISFSAGKQGRTSLSVLPFFRKERNDMNRLQPEKKKKIVPKTPVKIIVSREFVGDKSISEVFIPTIYEDIRRTVEQSDTFDTADRIA